MKQKGSDISELAFRAFIRSYGLFRTKMTAYFADFGISGAQWGILRALYRAELEGIRGLRFKELVQRLLVRPPSVTSLVDGLERRGWAARQVVAGDQRGKHVKLTPKGRKLVARVLKKHPAQIKLILAGLNRTEQRELHHLMDKFAMYLESLK